MNNSDEFTTWNGKAVSGEPPHGASIIVYRKAGQRHKFPVLTAGRSVRISPAIGPGRRREERVTRGSRLKIARELGVPETDLPRP
jgi:hypothetical protein